MTSMPLHYTHTHIYIYIYWVRTSKGIQCASVRNKNRLMWFREIIAVCCKNHTEHVRFCARKTRVLLVFNVAVNILASTCWKVKECSWLWVQKLRRIYKIRLHIKYYKNIKVYYSPTDAQVIVLKTILKFTLSYLQHVSVQSHHLQGTHYPCLLKLHFVKIVNFGLTVYD
jgi:hypothetical protein